VKVVVVEVALELGVEQTLWLNLMTKVEALATWVQTQALAET
jgi:hypothetical protein